MPLSGDSLKQCYKRDYYRVGRRLEVDASQKTCLLSVHTRSVLAIRNPDVSRVCSAAKSGKWAC
jgi:hypothetical protein